MAHKNSLLTKRREPKPRKKMPVSKARTGVQSQNSASPNSGAFCLCREKRSVLGKTWLQRRQKRKPANYRKKRSFLQFWHKAVAQEMAFSMPKLLSLLFDYFAKSRVCLAFPKANTRSLHKTPAYNRKKRSFLQLLCLCKEKRSFFDKPRLQRLPKRSSVLKISFPSYLFLILFASST